jgi:hypothetical protein
VLEFRVYVYGLQNCTQFWFQKGGIGISVDGQSRIHHLGTGLKSFDSPGVPT